MKVIYLDNNATTQCAPAVVEAMLPYFSQKYGNASSMHTFGGSNRHAIDLAREQVAALIGAAYADEIIFTSCATESDNTAIFSAVRSFPKKKHIITSAVEHPAIMEPFKYLEAQGYRVDFIGVDEKGRFDMDRFKSVLDEDTALVSVMWANSETGTIFPIADIARLAHQKGALFHTDAVQAVGKIPVQVQQAEIDMLSLSGHKFHGPKGVGALYVRRGTRFMPYLMGGHQEKHRRAGTENVPYIAGMAAAASPIVSLLRGQKLKDSIAQTREMEKICIAKNHNFPIPNLDFDFLPVGIDIRLVLKTGICPIIHGGNFHKEGGLVGAGTARVPMECFQKALKAFAEKYSEG